MRPLFKSCKEDVIQLKGKKGDKSVLRYSIQLVMLNKLRNFNVITEDEYAKIKSRLMQDYDIISDWTA